MLDGFEALEVDTGETVIFSRRAGTGPPVLLLHGFPQTHLMWRGVAPLLARDLASFVPTFAGTGAAVVHHLLRTMQPMPSKPWRGIWWR